MSYGKILRITVVFALAFTQIFPLPLHAEPVSVSELDQPIPAISIDEVQTPTQESSLPSTSTDFLKTTPLAQAAVDMVVTTPSNPNFSIVERDGLTLNPHFQYYDIYKQDVLITSFIKSKSYGHRTSSPTSIRALSLPDASSDGQVLVYGFSTYCTTSSSGCLGTQQAEVRRASDGAFITTIILSDFSGGCAATCPDEAIAVQFAPNSSNLIKVTYSSGAIRLYDIKTGALAGDINKDGAVNQSDVDIVSAHWMTSNADADVNHDGIVNIFDLGLISDNWTETVAPLSASEALVAAAQIAPAPTTEPVNLPASLNLIGQSSPNDGVTTVSPNIAGIHIQYTSGQFAYSAMGGWSYDSPVDLSSLNEIIVSLKGQINSSEGNFVNFFLRDETGGSAYVQLTGVNPDAFQKWTIPSSAFSAIDLTKVKTVEFWISGYNVALSSLDVGLNLTPGDTNLDGNIDQADYSIWADHYLKNSSKAWADGDFNGDGKVDGADYTIWADHYGDTASPAKITALATTSPAPSYLPSTTPKNNIQITSSRRYKMAARRRKFSRKPAL